LFLPYEHTKQFYRISDYGQVLHSAHLEVGMLVTVRGYKERIAALLRDLPELIIQREPQPVSG